MRRRPFLLLGSVTLATAGCHSFAVEAALKRPSELTATAVAQTDTASARLGRLAFIRGGDVWIKELPDGPEQRLTRDGRNDLPLWSPTGEWLAFRRQYPDTSLHEGWVVRRTGSEAHGVGIVDFAEGVPGSAMAWSPIAERLAYVSLGGLFTVNANGTDRQVLIPQPDKGPGPTVTAVAWSPDGQWLAVQDVERTVLPRGQGIRRVNAGNRTIADVVRSPDAAQSWALLAGWAPDGTSLLYWLLTPIGASIQADGLALMRTSVTVEAPAQVSPRMLAHRDFLSWSPDGQTLALVVGAGRQTWDQKAIAVASTGQAFRHLSPGGVTDLYPAWSPDGKRLAFTSGPEAHGLLGGEKAQQALQGRRIWVMNADGSHRHALTSDPTYRDERPLWSADGTHLLFARFKGDVAQLWLMDADGGNPRLVVGDLTPAPPFFANDGYTEWASLYDWWRGPARSSASSPPTPIPTATSTAVPTRTPATTATPMPTASADPFAAYLDAARADLGSTEGQAASVTIGAVRLQDLARQRGVRLRYLVPSDAGQVDAWIGFAEPGTAFILWRDGATIRGEVWTSRDQPFFLYFVNPVRTFRLVRQNGALELGLIPASLGSTGDAIFVLARFTEGHWQQVWSPFPAAKDSWASSGGSVELVGPGIDTLHLKGPIPPDVPASRVFDEFGAALKQQYESEWQRQGDRYVRVSGQIVPRPFTSLANFVDRLQRGDRTGAAALAADPSLVDRALQLGLGKPASGRGWWATNETTANGVVTITFFDNADRSRAFAVALAEVRGAWRVKAIDRWQAPNR